MSSIILYLHAGSTSGSEKEEKQGKDAAVEVEVGGRNWKMESRRERQEWETGE